MLRGSARRSLIEYQFSSKHILLKNTLNIPSSHMVNISLPLYRDRNHCIPSFYPFQPCWPTTNISKTVVVTAIDSLTTLEKRNKETMKLADPRTPSHRHFSIETRFGRTESICWRYRLAIKLSICFFLIAILIII